MNYINSGTMIRELLSVDKHGLYNSTKFALVKGLALRLANNYRIIPSYGSNKIINMTYCYGARVCTNN